MKISALLTSAGINIGLCTLFLSLYSILRKQPSNLSVYFGRRLSEEHNRRDSFSFDRLVPSAGWLMKAWRTTDEEILSSVGLDAVVFLRMLVFSIRIFAIAAGVCLFGVLPFNYYGNEMTHTKIHLEKIDVFSIANVEDGSQWLWIHCLALYIISSTACFLLYLEYRNISRMRLAHITESPPNPRHFSVLVRSIPRTHDEPFDVTIVNFFTKYHGSSYLSHQMISQAGTVQKIMYNAKKVYKKIIRLKNTSFNQHHRSSNYRCGLCGGGSRPLHTYHNAFELEAKRYELESSVSRTTKKDSSAAFVFFKTRYAAVVASQIPQSSDPMLWAIDLAPEPNDVYWSNLWVPYRLVWLHRITVQIATLAFMVVFTIPVTFVQGLSHLDKLQKKFPVLRDLLKKSFLIQIVTGYLPSVLLMLALYTVPPVMMLLSRFEGCISHSGKRKSACGKVLYFTIWNVFFMNCFSASFIRNLVSAPTDIPTMLAKLLPGQAAFFITYVLTSGWASLSAELLQIFPLICNFIKRTLGISDDDPSVLSFPYYTEVPRVLLLSLIGFTYSVLAPLILPFLLVYFLLAYLVYRNQFMNVYRTKYDYGGQLWPLVHNTTIFSLVLTQVIALGFFGLKKSPIASGFTIPLVILTLLFNENCKNRFYPIFCKLAAQDLIEMDQQDEQSGRMQEIHKQLLMIYRQYPADTDDIELVDEEPQTPGDSSLNCLQRI
ncbi:uncharacterized protein A4U43_C08F18150 [Asparagus officinalis]|uniref:CSC1-like protein RXW8 isoform X2 n=1 Tax=Asparagus officinalis TaxID=4686 RepID=UPI00098DF89A|nr:CSC1-like protein RXW8 isoform X2 [Asparagus officinalis]ONK60411.1 uncharacterized protein A4U43_C08F18150 [Asparagus officinalis]